MAKRYNDYKHWLAAEVLSESKIVTYRMLSRELKVHVNSAKKMLYDFHRTENARKPGSVHATYLLYGLAIPKPEQSDESQQDREDRSMASSPFMSSSAPQEDSQQETTPRKVMTLAREEHLEAAKAKYDELLSIHVYSLEPSTINNFHILTDCNRQIRTKHAHEDPLEYNKHYGTILNPQVRRRTVRRPPAPAAVEPTKLTQPSTSETNEPAKAPERPSSSKDPAPSESKTSIAPQPEPSAQKVPALKKESSSLFKSFSKTPAPAPKPSTSNKSIPDEQQEDEAMKNAPPSSESEDETTFLPSASASKATGPSKSEREATLRKMMDEESHSDSSMHDATPTEENPPQPEPESEPKIEISNGRRRGRRKITKKKTMKDEEGYLVTKEEIGWESFSESEKEAPAAKKPVAARGGKRGGGGGRGGQGSIMSFFGKGKT